MRVAFFSFEFPEETGGGGIGTYLELVTGLLSEAGHSVVVFTATSQPEAYWENDHVFRIPAANWNEFNTRLPEYFLPVHEASPFDVAECTDFNGCGLYVKQQLPQLPVVVRLHTPLYVVDRLQYQPLSFFKKMRFLLGAFKRKQKPRFPQTPDAKNYQQEFEMLRLAERVMSPSFSITRKMSALGFDLKDKTDQVPLPFVIYGETANIQSRDQIRKNPQIIFVGRLEIRKGVIDLAKAIPAVLRSFPNTHFTFIGESSFSPDADMDMQVYLKKMLDKHAGSITFMGKVPHESMIGCLTAGDIFVFPSHYESFGLACCEAMAAGKAVIASEEGGMSEIIENGRSGLLVRPFHSNLLAGAINTLLDNDQMRLSLGRSARERIRTYLNAKNIINAQLECYRKAIDAVKKN